VDSGWWPLARGVDASESMATPVPTATVEAHAQALGRIRENRLGTHLVSIDLRGAISIAEANNATEARWVINRQCTHRPNVDE
jgi:hypothetical protein